jgi:hypothetical protein
MAAGIEREKISAVDTAWLRMDSPQNRMIICGVLIFRERPDFARLKEVVTGRFLRHFVYEGFNEDEHGARVFDGLFDQVGGAGRGSFNHRFGQQSRDQLQHFNILYPVDMFPFTDAEQLDPETGITDGLLARATRSNTVPSTSASPTAHSMTITASAARA